MTENRDAFDCRTCELMKHVDGLWIENAEAWGMYQKLCGRTVREGQLEGWLLERMTADWSTDDVHRLLDRLDLIGNVLEPHGDTQDRHRR